VDMETRTVDFQSGNVTQQLQDDIEKLFGEYAV
jgi:hypothetical protein